MLGCFHVMLCWEMLHWSSSDIFSYIYMYMYVIITAFLCWSSCVGSLSSSPYDLQLVGSHPCYTHSKIIKNMEWRKTGSIPKHVYWERERQKRGIIVCKFNISYIPNKIVEKKGCSVKEVFNGEGGGLNFTEIKNKINVVVFTPLAFSRIRSF